MKVYKVECLSELPLEEAVLLYDGCEWYIDYITFDEDDTENLFVANGRDAEYWAYLLGDPNTMEDV